MYLPERLRSLPLKSLYYGVLLVMVITLSLSFLVFHEISDRMQKNSIDPAFDRFDEVELESARAALTSGGPKALKDYLATWTAFGGSSHYLLDARGMDLVSGETEPNCCRPLHAPSGAAGRMVITSGLTGRRTGSIGLPRWASLTGRTYGRFFPSTSW
jgi:hypothetical protein